jgi:hypothetical protein
MTKILIFNYNLIHLQNMRFQYFLYLSLLFHSILFININKDSFIKKIDSKIKIKLVNQIINTNKSKYQIINLKEKVFHSDINNQTNKNKTTIKKGKFQKQKTKKITFNSLTRSMNLLDKNQVTQSPDYTPNTELSDVIEFNTIRYKYYSFFKRIQDNLSNTWKPYPFKSFLKNTLIVTIDNNGEIINISIYSSSGNYLFDDSTIKSFLELGRINNPPKDLIRKGKFKFQWSFILN